MKMKWIIAALAISKVVAFQDVRENFKGDRVVDIHADVIRSNPEVFNTLQLHEGDHLGTNKENDKLSIKISPQGFEALKSHGIELEDSTEKWIAELQANLDDPNLFCTESAENCAARSLQDFYSSYQELDALTARIKSAVAAAPTLAKIQSIGTSYEGRTMNVVLIGDQSLPLAFFMCNIHAREWLPPMYCSYMIETLLANGGHRLLKTFSFAIIPTGNPDGYVYTRTKDNMWRKNRQINSGSTCVGTDPNRNYDNNHCGAGTSKNPCSDIYCGPKPFSTPETNNINNFAKTVANRLITWIDFHSYASYWLSPLGYTTGTPPAVDYNRMKTCMAAAVAAVKTATGSTFKYGPAGDMLGAAAGASDDYFYFAYDVIYSFTVEMRGSSFQPAASNINPSNKEIFAGMVAQMDCIANLELAVGKMPPLAETPTSAPTCSYFFC